MKVNSPFLRTAFVILVAVILGFALIYVVFLKPMIEKGGLAVALGGPTSTAIIQILPTTPVLADPNFRTEHFIANEIASLSMGAVIERASADSDWEARGVDARQVKQALTVTRIEGTDLARITVPATEKVSGKEIIMALLNAYMEVRGSLEEGVSQQQLKALDDELIAQSDLVQDNRKELTVLIQQYGIPYFENEANPLGKDTLTSLARANETLLSVEEERILLEAKLAIAEGSSEQDKELLTRFKELQKQEEMLGKRVEKLREISIDLSLKQNRYLQAKEAYEQSRQLLNEMKLRQQEARVALKMPREFLIIREKPE